jgi:hypothetical protein
MTSSEFRFGSYARRSLLTLSVAGRLGRLSRLQANYVQEVNQHGRFVEVLFRFPF